MEEQYETTTEGMTNVSEYTAKNAHRAKGPAALLAIALFALATFFSGAARAQIAVTPPELERVGVKEKLDGPLPLDTPFRDHTGAPVTLRKYFDGKRPVVLQFAYHTCPVVCGMITHNLAAGLKGVPWTIGQEFDVVTISIDPDESLPLTAAKRQSVLHEYGRFVAGGEEGKGWHFLVGDESAIAAVADASGFEYQYDERQKQWGHPSVVMIVKPNGQLARYLYGLEFPANDLRLGLIEAAAGRSISTIEQIILFCYHYDPQGGKYVLVAMRVMQVGGAIIALVVIGGLGLFWGREIQNRRRRGGANETSGNDALKGETSTSIDLANAQPAGDPTAVSVRGG